MRHSSQIASAAHCAPGLWLKIALRSPQEGPSMSCPGTPRFMPIPAPAILPGQPHTAFPGTPLAHACSSLSYLTKAALAWYVQGPPGSHLLFSSHSTRAALPWHTQNTPDHACSSCPATESLVQCAPGPPGLHWLPVWHVLGLLGLCSLQL